MVPTRIYLGAPRKIARARRRIPLAALTAAGNPRVRSGSYTMVRGSTRHAVRSAPAGDITSKFRFVLGTQIAEMSHWQAYRSRCNSDLGGVQIELILSVGDQVGVKDGPAGFVGQPRRMAGIPDGLGAFDNGDGTMTVLMNHELPNTCPFRKSYPDVLVVQPGQDWDGL